MTTSVTNAANAVNAEYKNFSHYLRFSLTAMAATVPSALVTQPIDTVKTHLQTQEITNRHYKGAIGEMTLFLFLPSLFILLPSC